MMMPPGANRQLRDALFGTATAYQEFVRNYLGPQKVEAEIEGFVLA